MAIARVITDKGLKELTKLHAKITDSTKAGRGFSHIGIGTGTQVPRSDDPGLQAEIVTGTGPNRKLAAIYVDAENTGDASETTVMYVATWNPGDIATSNDEVGVTEVGLFNGPLTTDIMYYRETRGVLTVSGTVGLTIKIRCKFSRIV